VLLKCLRGRKQDTVITVRLQQALYAAKRSRVVIDDKDGPSIQQERSPLASFRRATRRSRKDGSHAEIQEALAIGYSGITNVVRLTHDIAYCPIGQ